MKILDKILIGTLSVLGAVCGLFLIFIAIGWPVDSAAVQNLLTALNNPWIAILACIFALLVIALSVRVMYSLFRKDSHNQKNVAVLKSETGASYISTAALNSIVSRAVRSNQSVKDCKTYVRSNGEAVVIRATISALSGVQIPMITEQLQETIRTSVEAYTGVKVDRVEVVVSATEDEPGKTRSRVS